VTAHHEFMIDGFIPSASTFTLNESHVLHVSLLGLWGIKKAIPIGEGFKQSYV